MPATAPPIDVEAQVRQHRDRCMEIADALTTIAALPDAERERMSPDADRLIRELDIRDRALQAHERAQPPQPAPLSGPLAATRQAARQRMQTAGEAFTASPEYEQWARAGAHGSMQIDVSSAAMRRSRQSEHYQAVAAEMETRALLSESLADPSAGVWLPQGTPFLAAGAIDRRRLFIEDLVPSVDTTLASVPYIQELNPRTNEEGAGMVAEGTLKPEVVMQSALKHAIAQVVAAWLPATRQILADAPLVMSYVDGRLQYLVDLRAEEQVLNGDGTGANLLGIRQQPGLQTNPGVIGDPASSLGNSIAQIENVDLEADGIAMNALDYWAMVIRRHTGGNGAFDQGSPFSNTPNNIWGLPTVRTRSMPQGKALVGAFRLAAQILNREGYSVRTGEQHADYFIRNQLAILGERRLALAVFRPDGFVEVTLPPAV